MMCPQACKKNCSQLSPPTTGALYLHVPLCRRKCTYCDFYSIPICPETARDFVTAAIAELDAARGDLTVPLRSVFVGGGTPTAMDAKLLEILLRAVGPLVDKRTEFTVEANPGTIDPAIAGVLASAGVNRLSLGVQSLDVDELRTLGRIHTPDEVRRATDLLRSSGISNLSVDLIYGIPGQTPDSWRQTLRGALELAPQHVSCYALSFEGGTPLSDDLLSGRVAEMSDSLQKGCWLDARRILASAGFEHYEISNFALAESRCDHNITYWKNEPYVGIGPGAASYVNGYRTKNRPDLPAYIAAALVGKPVPCDSERLTGRKAMAETLMLALRMTQGVAIESFKRRFNVDPLLAFPRTFARYAELGAIEVSDSHVRLSPDALFVSDTILADILAEA